MTRNKERKEEVEFKPVVSLEQKKCMLATMIRNEPLFLHTRDKLEFAMFLDDEIAYRLVWSLVQSYYDEFKELPARGGLIAALDAMSEVDSSLTSDVVDEAAEFIKQAFRDKVWGEDLSTSPKYKKLALGTLKSFREEYILDTVRGKLDYDKSRVADVAAFFKASYEDVAKAQAITMEKRKSLAPRDDEWARKKGIGKFTTGIDFLDTLLGGGHAPCEVYGFMAPFGACKTTLAVQLAVEAAREAHRIFLETGRMEYVFLATYEAPLENEIRFRALQCAANISRYSFENLDPELGLAGLSTKDKLKPYEEVMYRQTIAEGTEVQGEQERLEEIRDILDKHLIVLDMTGAEGPCGNGFIEEIMAGIESYLDESPKDSKVRAIIVDYVGKMVDNYMVASKQPDNQQYVWIRRAVGQAKTTLATRYKCPVWLMHQLSGRSNNKVAGAGIHHTEAAGSTSWAENLDFAIQAGVPNDDELLRVDASKHRRTKQQDYRIVKLDGETGKMKDTSDLYLVDPTTKLIRPREEVESKSKSVKASTQDSKNAAKEASRKRIAMGD